MTQKEENIPDYGKQGKQDRNKPATKEESRVPRLQNSNQEVQIKGLLELQTDMEKCIRHQMVHDPFEG